MMSYSRCFSLMAPFCFLTVAFGLNEWSKTVGSDGTQIWNSTSDFVPVQSQSFGSIKIGRIMTVEFDFVFWGRTNDPKQNQREMFFRIGYDAEDGKGCDGQQSQYPSFWLSQDDDTLIVINSEEGDCTHRYDLDEYGAFSIGIAYHIHIAFDDDTFSIHISGGDKSDWINQWPRSPTSKSHLGDEVPIWFMSDRFGSSKYNRANGTFSDMIIISRLFTYEPTTTTIEPTTTEPTTEQTLEETKMSQPSSVTSPTVTSAAHLAKGPTADSDSNSSLLDLDSIITEAVGVILLAVLLTLIYCSFNKWRSRRFEAIERSVTELTDAQSFSRTITETATLTYPVPGLQNNISDRPALTPNNSRPVSPSASQRQRLDFKNNALAVVICIAHYDDPTYNIVGIEKDYHNLRGLFQFLNFDMIPMNRNKPFYWTQEEVIHLLTRQIKEALFKGKDDAQYDALIVCISSHGSKGSVITSDLKQIEKDVIHRAVSHYHPELRQIPRFFVIDACDGQRAQRISASGDVCSKDISRLLAAMKPTITPIGMAGPDPILLTVSEEAEDTLPINGVGLMCNLSLLDQRGNNIWTESQKNPDYNLALIRSANIGFQAKARGDRGSDFMFLFVQKVKQNCQSIENGEIAETLRVQDICDQIQDELQQDRQLPVFTFNNDTRYIVLGRNNNQSDSKMKCT